MPTSRLIGLFSILALLLVACSGGPPPDKAAAVDRPGHWATPMGDSPGLSNFFRVSDQLYRGAQPDEEGFMQLKALGVKTVVNLRTFNSDSEECEEAGLRYIHISVQAWDREDEEVVEFLRVVTDPENQPVFVHCLHGADRTGVMSAVYRIAIQEWSKEQAIQEMTEGGFGFHSVWQNLIDHVEELDVARVKELSGVERPSQVTDGDAQHLAQPPS